MRVLIVDDERLAREGVRTLLEAERDVEVAGECGDGRAAIEAIRAGAIDVVLLDIQMPGLDGFDVVRAFPDAQLPVVIFLTAFSQHALRAFDAHALDYLVKPFADDRFRTAIARARRQVQQRRLGKAGVQLASIVAGLTGASTSDDAETAAPISPSAGRSLARIPVRGVGKVTYVRVADIVWIGAADYYAELHTKDGRRHLVRETLQHLEERLDPLNFIRVHRSAIVHLDHVAEIRTDSAERQLVVLRDGTQLPLGKPRREALERALGER